MTMHKASQYPYSIMTETKTVAPLTQYHVHHYWL